MDASIVIITKSQKSYLQQTLPMLLKQRYKGKYEIIVVDSGSTDGALEYAKSLPVRVVRIKPEDFGYAYAFNTGARHAKGDYIIRLSGDCIPLEKTFLHELLLPFADEKVGGTYGRYTISGKKKGYGYPIDWPAEKFSDVSERYSFRPNFLFGLREFGDKRKKLFRLAGGACAVRRSIWKKRSFNESLGEGEDGEYAWFLHLLEFDIVYCPKARTLHEHKTIERTNIALRIKYLLLLIPISIIKYWFLRSLRIDPYRNLKTPSDRKPFPKRFSLFHSLVALLSLRFTIPLDNLYSLS